MNGESTPVDTITQAPPTGRKLNPFFTQPVLLPPDAPIPQISLTPDEVRRENVVSNVALSLMQMLERGETPSVDMVKAYLTRLVTSFQQFETSTLVLDFGGVRKPAQSSARFFVGNPMGKDYKAKKGEKTFIRRDVSTQQQEGYIEIDAVDALKASIFNTLHEMKPQESAEIMRHIVDSFDGVPLESADEFIPQVLRFIYESPNRDELFSCVMDYIYEHRDAYTYAVLEGGTVLESLADEIMWVVGGFSPNHEPVMRYLATQQDAEKMKILLGIFIDSSSYADAINLVRSAIDDPANAALRLRLEGIGRILLGFPPDSDVPFYTCLGDFYHDVHLNEQPYLEATRGRDIEIVVGYVEEHHLQDAGFILDEGCGQGKFSNALAARGIRGVIAIDLSEDNLRDAKEADTSGLVTYRKADWNNVDFLPDGSVSGILNCGRNLHHVEHYRNLWKCADEMKRLLKRGGRVLLDFADNNKGKYREFRLRFLGILKGLGIPFEREGDLETQFLL